MLRYFALLRDSFREATDAKVLYFTLALSVALIGFLGSIHFRPMTAREQVESVLSFLNDFLFPSQAQFDPKATPRARITEYRQLREGVDEAAEPWDGDYRIVVELTLPEGIAHFLKNSEYRLFTRLFLSQQLVWMKGRSIEEDTKDGGRTAVFTITSRGSKLEGRAGWRHDPEFFFGLFSLSSTPFGLTVQQSLTFTVFYIENYIVNNVGGWVIVLIGVVVTAGFVPNLMQKGAVDLLLVKPLHRPTLLVFKYLGGLTFVLLNALFAIGGVWLVLGLRTGVWAPAVLLTPFLLTFSFAVLYAVSTLVGVVTRNALVCILATCLAWGFLFVLGQANAQLNPRGAEGAAVAAGNSTLDWVSRVVGAAQTVLPRTNDLGKLTSRLLRDDVLPPAEQEAYRQMERQERQMLLEKQGKAEDRSDLGQDSEVAYWSETLATSLGFIAVLLGLACWRFTVRDY